MESGLTAAEPTVSAARKCQTVSGISEHVWHEASALCKCYCMQTSFPDGYCTYARCQEQNNASFPAKAGSGSDTSKTLPVFSLLMVTSKEQPKEHFLFDLSSIPVSLTNPPCQEDGRTKLPISLQWEGRTKSGHKQEKSSCFSNKQHP